MKERKKAAEAPLSHFTDGPCLRVLSFAQKKPTFPVPLGDGEEIFLDMIPWAQTPS